MFSVAKERYCFTMIYGIPALTSCEVLLHVINYLIVVTDDVVSMNDHRYLFPKIESHKPGLFVLSEWHANIPFFTW